jgi:heme exporter protein B
MSERDVASVVGDSAETPRQEISQRYWSTVWATVWKDLTIERHTRQTVTVMVIFSLASVITFNFGVEQRLGATREVALGLLWVTIFLAGTLGLNRSFSAETENSALAATLIAPVERSALYVGKVISTTLSALVVEAIMVPMFIVFFDKPLWRPVVLLVLFFGTLGYMAAGVLVSAMAAQTRSRAVLVPVLLLPLTLPTILAATSASADYMFDPPPAFSEIQGAFALVVTYDILMLVAGVLTYNYVVEE